MTDLIHPYTSRYIYLSFLENAVMVSHINFAVDDELAERGRAVKQAHDWTWEELFEAAVEEFEHGNE